MRLIKCYMTQSTWYKDAANGTPKGVLWHSTGANNPNISRYVQPDDKAADRAAMIALIGKNKYGNDWNHIDRDAGVHAWIGKLADGSIATVEAGPYEKKAWGCGDKASRLKNGWSLNETHIQFEICEGDLNDKEYFEKVYQEAVEYTAMLCKKYGWDPMGTFTYRGESIPVITDHAGSHAIGHGGNHGDVGHWFRRYLGSDYLNEIRRDVATQIVFDELGTEVETPTQPQGTIKEGDLVKITGSTYYSGKDIPSWVKGQNWYVHSVSGDRVVINENEKKTNSIMSPVKASSLALVKAKITITGTPSTGSAADEKKIWDFLYGKIGNYYGVAGVMGNLYAECGLRSNNLQNAYEKSLGYTDDTYTKAVDNGTYTNFVKDSAGYGLAQWTYWSRKEALLTYAKSKQKSIGDFDTQLEFLWKELSENYKGVVDELKSAKTVLAASNSILMKYERPADQSEAVQNKRAAYGQTYYDKYAPKPVEPPKPVVKPVETPKQEEPKKSVETLAKEILQGKWGNGTERKNKLEAAGYNYSEVQTKVNELCGATTKPQTPAKPAEIKVGSLVKITGSKYYGGQTIPSWVKNQNWYVCSISGDRVVINQNEKKTSSIMSPVKKSDLVLVR